MIPIHRALLLASVLMLTTQLWADPCVSENAAVNQIRQWVVHDLQFNPSELPTNEAKLTAAIDVLGQCEHIDFRKAEPIVKDFANFLCITPPLASDNTRVELSADAKVKLDGIVKKIAGIDLGGAAKYSEQKSKGVLQSDLAKAIKDSNDCKVAVFVELYARLTTHVVKRVPKSADPSSGYASVGCEQGLDVATPAASFGQNTQDVDAKAVFVNTANLKSQSAHVDQSNDANNVPTSVLGRGHIDGLDRDFFKNCPGGGHAELKLHVTWTEEVSVNQ
jgi:hypothetical protein